MQRFSPAEEPFWIPRAPAPFELELAAHSLALRRLSRSERVDAPGIAITPQVARELERATSRREPGNAPAAPVSLAGDARA